MTKKKEIKITPRQNCQTKFEKDLLSCFGSALYRLLLNDALEHSANILDQLIRLVPLESAKLKLLLKPRIRVQHLLPIPYHPPGYGGGRGRNVRELLPCPLRLRRSIRHRKLELVDPRFGLVQPAERHQ
jgi:hypothetical protein